MRPDDRHLKAGCASVGNASPRFVVPGDFNRRIDDEQAIAVPRDQVRAGVDPGCRGFVGLDHIVASAALHAALARLQPAATAARKVPVANRPGQPIESSDHCPQLATVLLQGRRSGRNGDPGRRPPGRDGPGSRGGGPYATLRRRPPTPSCRRKAAGPLWTI